MAISKAHKSLKHDIISKDSTKILISVGVTVSILIFCLFAMKALLSQSFFNNKVISAKKTALDQLNDNKEAVEDLRTTYSSFVNQQQNILGGSASGNGPVDGDNAQLIIDALPEKYDIPALSSSIEKILKDGGYSIDSIGGSDEGTALLNGTNSNKPAEIPYLFSVSASVESTRNLLKTLERSIRPIYITSLGFQATDTGLRSVVRIKTFYADATKFELDSKEIKQ